MVEPVLETLAPPNELPTRLPDGIADEDFAITPPQVRGAPTSGRVPQPPTTEHILDSVQASAQSLEITEPEPVAEPTSDYSGYGHVVDLEIGAAVQEESPAIAEAPAPGAADAGIGGLIQDPLRRRDSQAARGGPASAPSITKHVTVGVTRSELQQGRTIRILLDLRIEP